MDVMAERSLIDAKFEAITPRAISGLALAVHNLTKYFPKGEGYKHVFNDITFGVRCNDVFGLLGPNGAGKTTLINILAGKLAANAGDFKVFGHAGSERSVVRQLIGVVPQFDIFFDNLTVREHLTLVARLHGVRRAEGRPGPRRVQHDRHAHARRAEAPAIPGDGDGGRAANRVHGRAERSVVWIAET